MGKDQTDLVFISCVNHNHSTSLALAIGGLAT